ncbi:MAG: TonB-dependent receptor [Bacteroidota bacterium]
MKLNSKICILDRKKIKGILSLWFLFGLSLLLPAQPDSLLLPLDRLGLQDLLLGDSILTRTQVSAASKSLQNISELPFPIYVIRRSEIISNGYITLADALKSMPGIRVSQPGSALEGETFTMRGLLGNTYAKILINGNPIKPYVVSGMPIGAQLPIQQAERIEVIYGPAAALYGADASAGIVNIVLADSERPVFTKASLHIGSDNYKSMNLLFGGKIGRGKDIVRFRLYGMDTRFDDRRIFYDQEVLYDPSNYIAPIVDSADIFGDPNFSQRGNGLRIQDLPHESRSLGGELTYRFLSFSVLNMNRRDHSAIGYNPSAVNFSNPLATTGENITSVIAKARFDIQNIQSETQLSLLNYEMDNRSNSQFVHPLLNAFLNGSIQDTNAITVQSLKSQIENNFFSGARFMGARSTEYSLEQTFNIPIFFNGELIAGLKYLRGSGNSLREFQDRIIDFDRDETTNLVSAFEDEDIEEASAFFQLFQPIGNRMNLLVGGQYLNRTNGDFAAPIRVFNPRVALLYKLSEGLQLRGSYGTAIRAPSPYFSSTSYTFESENYDFLTIGTEQLEAEETQSYELGMRWFEQKNIDLDVSASYTRTNQFINYNISFEGLGPQRRFTDFTLGYFNDENSFAELFDFQVYLRMRDLIPSIQLGGTFSLNYSTGTESLTTTNLNDFDNDISALGDVRAHPNVLSRLALHAVPLPRVLIRIEQYFATRSLTRNSFRLNFPARVNAEPIDEANLYNDGYYTVDLSLNYEVNKNFLVYVKFFNLFSAKYAGIDASFSNDILFYNPQSLAIFHLGLNYELN